MSRLTVRVGAVDYLETRSDIDRTRLAFYGVSEAAAAGVILSALEPRLKTTVLQGAGLGEPVAPAAREILPWLDRYLGPVVHASTGVDSRGERDR